MLQYPGRQIAPLCHTDWYRQTAWELCKAELSGPSRAHSLELHEYAPLANCTRPSPSVDGKPASGRMQEFTCILRLGMWK
mmetsp:Transcript_105700/g.182298  ORF Transcript_105700/g.182298 Transcript_105700/m.182298 type:complete len:80 (-) Transcript_105700:724-963(-)